MAKGSTNAPGGGGKMKILGHGAPTAATKAKPGQDYLDLDTGSTYTCISAVGGQTTWQKSGATKASEIKGSMDGKSLADEMGVFHAGDTPPENKKLLWIDTGNESTIRYWNGTEWAPTHALWAT